MVRQAIERARYCPPLGSGLQTRLAAYGQGHVVGHALDSTYPTSPTHLTYPAHLTHPTCATRPAYPYDSRLIRSLGTPSSRSCATTVSRNRGSGVVPACLAATT